MIAADRPRPSLGSAAWLALLTAACGSDARHGEAALELPPPPAPVAHASDWASRVSPLPVERARPAPPKVREAALDDSAEDSDELVAVRRLVYRVNFVVPPGFRDARARLSASAGELHVDLSLTRLRARFEGPGWPVPEGSEVRLRVDGHGVYLFDGRGGRSLGAGELASWFEGRAGSGRSQSSVRVRREFGARAEAPENAPAELMCVLLAEWTNQPRGAIARRCSAGSLPPGFRFGPWSAELTAVVPMELPRRALRADESDPPAPIPHLSGGATLDPSGIARISPGRPHDDPAMEPAALTVHNRTPTRAVILAQGVPVGWVDAGASVTLEGFAPGAYRVGAIRPMGILRMPPRWVRLPGEITIGGPESPARRRAPDPAEPTAPPKQLEHAEQHQGGTAK